MHVCRIHKHTNICLNANVVVAASLLLHNIVVIAEKKNCRSMQCSSKRAREKRVRERECDTHTYICTTPHERRRRPRCIEILFRYYTAAVVVDAVVVVVGGNILPLPFWPFYYYCGECSLLFCCCCCSHEYWCIVVHMLELCLYDSDC